MLTKLRNKIEDGISEIGDIKLEEFGIYFSNQLSYFPEGINIIENGNERYNLVFTEIRQRMLVILSWKTGEYIMKLKMTLGWKIWCLAVLLFAAFMCLSVLSSSLSGTQLKLTPGQEVQWQVWRPFDTDGIPLKLGFQIDDSRYGTEEWEKRNRDLGDCAYSIKTGKPICQGEPVIIDIILNNSKPCRMEAMNKSSSSTNMKWRNLSPIWQCTKFAEKSGSNRWQAKVVSVSPVLAGEVIDIQADAPLGLKEIHGADYAWMILAIFWPIYVAILVLWALILWRINRRKKRIMN